VANSKPYRKNAAAVIVNSQGKILACKRADEFKSWQLPQGGIEEDETPEDAVLREAAEELGTSALLIIGNLEQPICYDWPEHLHHRGFCGQKQYYFLLKPEPGAKINLAHAKSQEFEAFEWLTISEFICRIGGFKQDAYREALKRLRVKYTDLFTELPLEPKTGDAQDESPATIF
jgi:putative (di)nucleoside polyphosphate hydrolase